jgi:hypothetical protein
MNDMKPRPAILALDPDHDTFGPRGAVLMVSVSGTAVVL